jgi:asparagine synthase (glutamine-hydrolysing)
VCGICGCFAAGDAPPIAAEILERMTAALAHRGPDGRGVHIDGPCGLGHARLSIIDLAGGRQPILNEDGSVAVVCNGEIYNFETLRTELLQRGHRFRTKSDSEVLVHLWEDKGPACVERLRGMFAFAIYDRNRRLLFGARDRFGQKPLFYHWDGRTFAFASEIKGLLPLPHLERRLDAAALDQFLFYQFVPHPRTMFEGVRSLPPGCTFLVEAGVEDAAPHACPSPTGKGVNARFPRDGAVNAARMTIARYWELRFEPARDSENGRGDVEHLERVETGLDDAVASHLVSDVPVGLFLSGGIDSSLIAAFAAKHSGRPLKTFSIAFPEAGYDESPFARMAAAHVGSEHREFCFEPEHVIERLEKLAVTFDQPLADRAAMPLQMLAEQTAAEVKVVLTGDGGDELFAGYDKYRRAARGPHWGGWFERRFASAFSSSRLARCEADPLGVRKLRSRLARQLVPEQECSYFKHYWEGWDRRRLYSPEFAEQVGREFEALDARLADDGDNTARLDPLNRMLRIDNAGYLPDDLLLKTDFSTMAFGLEARAPLLDHHLAEVAARLPVHLKATRQETKVALRRMSEKRLPPELVKRPKRGFAVPIRRWLQHELRDWTRDRLLTSSTTVPRYFRRDTVETILNEHAAGKRNHASKIYSLLVFELWHRKYLS